MTKINKLFRDRRGAGLTEYIILVGVIAVLALGAFKLFGNQVKATITGQTQTVGTIDTATTP
jgi:Flp pilus assembly pilin Flp